jgi:3-dehydroquinate synthase
MSVDKIDNILISNDLEIDFQEYLNNKSCQKLFVIVDENTERDCLPGLYNLLADSIIIRVKSGDENKSINSVVEIWNNLEKNGADSKSLIINLGGGVICDLGGFAASTYKRGISYINVPTTLLAQVDAAIGGKTAINLNSVKNLIGTFHFPDFVFIDVGFLKTLDRNNTFSGFAEILKHSLISNVPYWDIIKNTDLENINTDQLKIIIQNSIDTKKQFVKADPFEKNTRKALNFGHTFGHAFEGLFLLKNKPVLHGYAIAAGIICELYLSVLKFNFNFKTFIEISDYVIKYYGKLDLISDDFPLLLDFMNHDKKNCNDFVNFTLLEEIGKYKINNFVFKEEIFSTFVKYLNR